MREYEKEEIMKKWNRRETKEEIEMYMPELLGAAVPRISTFIKYLTILKYEKRKWKSSRIVEVLWQKNVLDVAKNIYIYSSLTLYSQKIMSCKNHVFVSYV